MVGGTSSAKLNKGISTVGEDQYDHGGQISSSGNDLTDVAECPVYTEN
jgi:hypothetical protein